MKLFNILFTEAGLLMKLSFFPFLLLQMQRTWIMPFFFFFFYKLLVKCLNWSLQHPAFICGVWERAAIAQWAQEPHPILPPAGESRAKKGALLFMRSMKNKSPLGVFKSILLATIFPLKCLLPSISAS